MYYLILEILFAAGNYVSPQSDIYHISRFVWQNLPNLKTYQDFYFDLKSELAKFYGPGPGPLQRT